MGPFIKTGSGDPSWSATLLVCYFILYLFLYNVGVWAPEPYCAHAQSAWDAINVGLFAILGNYLTRKGTQAFERIKGGASAIDTVVEAVEKSKKSDEEGPKP